MATRVKAVKRTGRPAWLATLLGVAVLVCTGFFLGVMMGIVTEEPGLVLSQLTSPRETVPWSTDPRIDGGEQGEPPGEREGGVGAPAAGLPAVAASAAPRSSQEHFSVQVGAFRHADSAESVASGLRVKGFPAHVTPAPKLGDGRWRVLVGPVASRSEADRIAGRLKAEEKLPTWVRSQ